MTHLTAKQRHFLDAYERLIDPLFRHSYLRMLNRDEAKRCAEKSFQRVWAYIEDEPVCPADERLNHLLFRIANGFIIDYRRSERSSQREVDLADQLIFVLRALDETERDMVVMNYIDGMDEQQIAKILKMQPRQVSKTLQSAVRQLHSLPIS